MTTKIKSKKADTYYVFTLPGLGSREEKFLGTLKVREKEPDYMTLLSLAKKRFGVNDGVAIRNRYRYSPYRSRSVMKH